MIRWILSLALLLQAAPAQDADKEAAELLKKVEERLAKAKTIDVEFEGKPQGPDRERLKGRLRIGGGGTFLYELTIHRGDRKEEIVLRSDGKAVIVNAPMPFDIGSWTPQKLEAMLRGSLSQSALMGMMIVISGSGDLPAIRDIRSEGREKVGDVEAVSISFGLDIQERPGMAMAYRFRQWIDPATLNILKRTMKVGDREMIDEPCLRFVIDSPIPAETFQFQLPANLPEGQAIQVARSVALFARFTGRLPKTLDDLRERPADLPADVFWPDGGFWIGGAMPSVAYSADAKGFKVGSIQEKAPPYSPVGAPTDRLKKFFTARVRLHLLRAAAEGYLKAGGTMPKSGDDLAKKPDSVQFWPEGGWVGGGKIPLDPWGEPFVIRGTSTLSISVAKSKSRAIKVRDLTPEERRGLEQVAMPAPGEKDLQELNAAIVLLGAEKLEEREAGSRKILAKGVGALRWVFEKLQSEKDPEVLTRLGSIRDQLKQPGMTWEAELKALFAGLAGPGAGPMMTANERMARWSLRTLVTAQSDFRSNDRDGNGIPDFWTQDVAGLSGLKPGTFKGAAAEPATVENEMLKLIEPALAKADATESRWDYPVFALKAPEPKTGYLFAALKHFESDGKAEPYNPGNGRHPDRYGFVAYPSEYGGSDRLTFIVSEENVAWCQDLMGEEVDTFPEKPEAEGWRKLD
jgi:hypothetical protein